MPRNNAYKRRRRMNYRRKRYYRRKGQNKYTGSVNLIKQALIVPDRIRTRIKLAYEWQMSGTLGIYQSYSFRLNSLYRPVFSGGSTIQPVGFDEISALYNGFKVLGNEMKLTAFSNSATAPPVAVVAYPAVSVTPVVSSFEAIQQPYSKIAYIGISAGGSAVRTFRNYMNVKTVFGVPNVSDEDYECTPSSNPTKTCYWHILTEDITSTATYTVNLQAIFTFYIECFSKNSLLQS